MENASPVYNAVQKIIELFDFSKDVSLYSYRDDFEYLWELSEKKQEEGKRISCVIDDTDNQSKWFSIGVWGAYYRSANVKKLILIGNKESLFPFLINIYSFDEGTRSIIFQSETFLTQFCGAVLSNKVPDTIEQDLIIAWKGLIYSFLSAPGDHHAVSNEIAPLVLNNTLIKLNNEMMNSNLKSEWVYNGIAINKEKKAILKLWEWSIVPFLSSRVENKDETSMPSVDKTDPAIKNLLDKLRNDFTMQDIWNVWSNARFLLIDDQAFSHGYEQIVKSVLALTIGDGVILKSQPNLPSSLEEIKDFQCLFLDLRLSERDSKSAVYSDLPSVKFAVELSQKDPSFPIIIFSSSQKREIDQILSKYKNIITCFRKPGIAGSVESIDGNLALTNLILSIKRACEMIENRIVYKKIEKIPPKVNIQCPPPIGLRQININNYSLKKLFDIVFLEERYDKAFTYPYSFIETLFNEESLEKLLPRIRFKFPEMYLKEYAGKIKLHDKKQRVHLRDIKIVSELSHFEFYLQALKQLRNIASHGVRSFDSTRRDAIIIMILFLNILSNVKIREPFQIDKEEIKELGELVLTTSTEIVDKKGSYGQKERITVVNFPLKRFYDANSKDDIKIYIKELFATTCYCGNGFRELFELYKMTYK